MESGRAVEPTGRRTQQERREATRRKLLDATVDVLVETGYAGLTTTDVCKRAGLSQGALFKHFASKAELLAAAGEDVFRLLLEDFRRLFERAAATDARGETALRQLWKTIRGTRSSAAFELYIAARTDKELSDSLKPIVLQHRENLRLLARELFPELAETPHFDDHVRMAHDAMQGAALGAIPIHDAGIDAMIDYVVALGTWITEGRARVDRQRNAAQ